ncbi:unnamed protein product [Musa textilis]
MPSALKPSTTASAGGDHGSGDGKSKDTPVAAKTIGFLVVFGIAASIAKALLAKPNRSCGAVSSSPRGLLQWRSLRRWAVLGSDSGDSRGGDALGSVQKIWGLRGCDQGSKRDHRKQDLRRKEADHPLTDLNLSASVTSLTSSPFSLVVGFVLELMQPMFVVVLVNCTTTTT